MMRFVVAPALLIAPLCSAQQFVDGTFFDSRWTSAKVLDTTPLQNATWSAIRSGSLGNPGDCRTIAHSWQIVPSGVSIVIGHLFNDAVVDPAAGPAIVGIDWSLDARCDSAPVVNGIAFGPLLRQGGHWYSAPGGAALAGAGWVTLGGPASNWGRIGGPGAPDFSPAGGPIEFGFYTGNGGSGTTLQNLATGKADNYLLRVRRTCAGDLNADGQVDDDDFVLFAQGYNLLDCADPAMPPGCPADLNRDGFADDDDFVIFAAAYNDLLCP